MKGQDYVICPSCHTKVSHKSIHYARGKETNAPLFFCKPCGKKFGVRFTSIDWDTQYTKLYEHFFTKRHECHAIKARYHDFISPASQTLFNSRIRHYRKNHSLMLADIIKRSFLDRMRQLQAKASQRIAHKEHDNWDIIINCFDSEESYELDFYLLKEENRGQVFSNKNNNENPLIYCHQCNSTAITKNGYAPRGRRRFLCTQCKKVFVLKAENLFSHSYVEDTVEEILLGIIEKEKNEVNNMNLNQMVRGIASKFMHHRYLNLITKDLTTRFTISESYRIQLIQNFIRKYIQKVSGDP